MLQLPVHTFTLKCQLSCMWGTKKPFGASSFLAPFVEQQGMLGEDEQHSWA